MSLFSWSIAASDLWKLDFTQSSCANLNGTAGFVMVYRGKRVSSSSNWAKIWISFEPIAHENLLVDPLLTAKMGTWCLGMVPRSASPSTHALINFSTPLKSTNSDKLLRYALFLISSKDQKSGRHHQTSWYIMVKIPTKPRIIHHRTPSVIAPPSKETGGKDCNSSSKSSSASKSSWAQAIHSTF